MSSDFITDLIFIVFGPAVFVAIIVLPILNFLQVKNSFLWALFVYAIIFTISCIVRLILMFRNKI